MSHEWYSLEELARQLGRDRREIEKLVHRGRIPAHKVGNEWQFHSTEITQWLEQEMRQFSGEQLQALEEAQHSPEVDSANPIESLLELETVQVPLEARTKRSVLESLVEVAGRSWAVWEPSKLLQAMMDRENVFSTAFEQGVAIPHPRNPLPDVLERSVLAFGRTLSPIPYGGAAREGCDLFFLLACRDSRTHLQTLARLGRMIQSEAFLAELRGCEESKKAFDVICSFESGSHS